MSELAKKLIAEAKRTRSPFLDLGNLGLTEVLGQISEVLKTSEIWSTTNH